MTTLHPTAPPRPHQVCLGIPHKTERNFAALPENRIPSPQFWGWANTSTNSEPNLDQFLDHFLATFWSKSVSALSQVADQFLTKSSTNVVPTSETACAKVPAPRGAKLARNFLPKFCNKTRFRARIAKPYVFCIAIWEWPSVRIFWRTVLPAEGLLLSLKVDHDFGQI